VRAEEKSKKEAPIEGGSEKERGGVAFFGAGRGCAWNRARYRAYRCVRNDAERTRHGGSHHRSIFKSSLATRRYADSRLAGSERFTHLDARSRDRAEQAPLHVDDSVRIKESRYLDIWRPKPGKFGIWIPDFDTRARLVRECAKFERWSARREETSIGTKNASGIIYGNNRSRFRPTV